MCNNSMYFKSYPPCSVVIYLFEEDGNSCDEQSKDIHEELEKRGLQESILLTYIDEKGGTQAFQHLLDDSFYQVQHYKAILLYSRYGMNKEMKGKLYDKMSKRNVDVLGYCEDILGVTTNIIPFPQGERKLKEKKIR